MAEVFVAKVADFPDGERKIVQHGAHDIGVFHWEGQFYAYANMCLHQGGPACEGLIMHQVEDVIGPDKTWVGQKFSDSAGQFRLPVARLRIRHQDRRMRRRPAAAPEEIQRRPPRRRHLRRDLISRTKGHASWNSRSATTAA